MRYRKAIRWILYPVLALSVLAVAAYLVGGGFFGWVSVCGVCGAERFSTDFLWVFPLHRIKPTPLSDFVSREGIQEAHQHNWLFGQGGGAGVRCAIGDGRHLLSIIRDSGFQRFLAAVKKYRGVEESRRWLSIGLDPKRVNDLRVCFDPDAGAVKDRPSFERWFAEELAMWKEYEGARLNQSSEQPTKRSGDAPPHLP